MDKDKEVKITARVPESLRRDLKIRALQENTDLQELISRVLRQYLEGAPKRRKTKRK